MAFQRYGQHDQSYICDDIADLAKLPKANMGSTCYVIATAEKYMINSRGEWILYQSSMNGGGTGSAKYATIEYVNEVITKVLPPWDDIPQN